MHGLVLVAVALAWRSTPAVPGTGPVIVPIEVYSPPARPSTSAARTDEGISGPAIRAPEVPVVVPTTVPAVAVDRGTWEPPPMQTLVRRELWGAGTSGSGTVPDSILLAAEVDDPVRVLKAQTPVYPAGLSSAGVSGAVELEFVVDTLGRCEPGSVRVASSTLPTFEQPAIDAVLGTIYRPARVRGRVVRQLVHQRVSFRVQ